MRPISISLFVFFFAVSNLSGQSTVDVEEASENNEVVRKYSVLLLDDDNNRESGIKREQKKNRDKETTEKIEVNHGFYREYYKDVLVTEGSYKLGKPDGFWNFVDFGGVINFSGKYKDGAKDSIWTYYRVDTLQAKMYYSNSQLDSAFSYYADGSPYFSRTSEEGKVLKTSLFYQNGNIKVFTPYVNELRDGVAIQGFENGNVFRKVEFRAGNPYELINTLNINGDPIYGGSLKEGTGTYIEYNIDLGADSIMKPTSIATFKDGILDGPYISYPIDDYVGEKGNYQNNNKVGEWISYDLNEILETTIHEVPDTILDTRNSIDSENGLSNFRIFNRNDRSGGYFPAGENGLMQFLANNIKYPYKAKNQGVQGTVYLSFLTDEEGNIKSMEVLRSPGISLDEEAMRVAGLLSRCNPLFLNGIPKEMRFNLPIRFTLR